MTTLRGGERRRRPVVGLLQHLGAGVAEQLDERPVAVVARHHYACPAVKISRLVHVNPSPEEALHFRQITIVAGIRARLHERLGGHHGLRRGGLRLHVAIVERARCIGCRRRAPERRRARDELPSRLLSERLLHDRAGVVGQRREKREIVKTYHSGWDL